MMCTPETWLVRQRRPDCKKCGTPFNTINTVYYGGKRRCVNCLRIRDQKRKGQRAMPSFDAREPDLTDHSRCEPDGQMCDGCLMLWTQVVVENSLQESA